MVHALKMIRDLLMPGGYLIDIRPKDIPAEIYGEVEKTSHLLGYIKETDDYIEYRQAAQAVECVLSEGLFSLVRSDQFDFYIHSDTLSELQAFLAEEWKDAIIPGEVLTLVNTLHPVRISVRNFVYANLMSLER